MTAVTVVKQMSDVFDKVFSHDAEVRGRRGPPITSGPFDYNLYISFIVKDAYMHDGAGGALSEGSMRLLAKSFESHLNRFQIVETQEQEVCWQGWEQENYILSGIPFRFTAKYDVATAGLQVAIGMLVRHVGNHYRTIINGPWHRARMPFKTTPVPDKFDYLSVPANLPDYYDDRGSVLPGLNARELSYDSLHHYRNIGDYCYYQGETLVR